MDIKVKGQLQFFTCENHVHLHPLCSSLHCSGLPTSSGCQVSHTDTTSEFPFKGPGQIGYPHPRHLLEHGNIVSNTTVMSNTLGRILVWLIDVTF